MFQEIIQELTNNHDQIITKFQEKIDSIESYYVLIAELISPTNIRLHIETEYDGGSIDSLCLKVMTVYVDRYETHSEDDIKTLVETELEKAKKSLNASFHNFQATHALLRLANLKKLSLRNQPNFMIKLLNKSIKLQQNTLALIASAPILRKTNYVQYFQKNPI